MVNSNRRNRLVDCMRGDEQQIIFLLLNIYKNSLGYSTQYNIHLFNIKLPINHFVKNVADKCLKPIIACTILHVQNNRFYEKKSVNAKGF